jgi:hypothetical protein
MGVRYPEFRKKKERTMNSYVIAHLMVLAARAGHDLPEDSLLEQAARLNEQSDRTDFHQEIESVDEQR